MLHRQGAIAGHAQQVARVFGFTAPDTLSLAILPLCGVFGFNQTLATLAAGKPSVLVESYEIDEIARLITQHRPTTMFGSDDMYARLLELMPGRWPFRSIKWAGYGAFNASLEDLPERAQPRGLRLVGLYGMSEVQALYARQPLNAAGRRAASWAAACRSRRSAMCACAIRRPASCSGRASPARWNAPARR